MRGDGKIRALWIGELGDRVCGPLFGEDWRMGLTYSDTFCMFKETYENIFNRLDNADW